MMGSEAGDWLLVQVRSFNSIKGIAGLATEVTEVYQDS